VGTAVMPRPFGAWGVPDKEMRALPGYRDAAQDKGEARRLLAAAGFGPGKPLRVELTTRAFAIYIDLASFVADQLRQVNVEATVKQIETSQFFPAMARRDYLIGANLTAAAIDDPDVYFYENYKCGTSRNYTDYCSEETDRLIELQSQELDRDRRQKLVWEIQRRLEADVARPMLGWRNEYFTQWPHVKNLVPHHSLYNYGRMQDVWLDR
jgi:peptide/nickel transport system substrate-binding protein